MAINPNPDYEDILYKLANLLSSSLSSGTTIHPLSRNPQADWMFYLFFKPLTHKNYPTHIISSIVPKMWKLKGSVRITEYHAGSFSAKFDLLEDLEYVYNNGPWKLNKHMLILERCSPNKLPSDYHFSEATFWVQIHGLPVNLLTTEFISTVTSRIGIITPPTTQDASKWVIFARIRIKIDITKPLLQPRPRRRFIVSSLGLKEALPAYTSPGLAAADLATGVSFASAGTGLDDSTAATSGVISMEKQTDNFREYVGRLKTETGTETAGRTVADALIIVGAGSNDMIFNFYLTPRRRTAYGTVANYHRFLLQRLQSFIQQIHGIGGRKFAISGLPPLGCLPLQITLEAMSPRHSNSKNSISRPQRVCVRQQNRDAVAYNTMLNNMLRSLRAALPDAKFAYVDIYNPLMDMIRWPLRHGFFETKLGCCGTGLIEMGPTCNVSHFTCPNPSRFIFWDSVHPSQATYQALAQDFIRNVLPQIY